MFWLRPRWFNKAISQEKAKWAYKEVLLRLNDLLSEVASENASEKWSYISGVRRQSEIKGWCSKSSWFVTFDDSMQKQGSLPENGKLSDTLTTGMAHPNIYGHNFMAWRIRCELENDHYLPKGSVFEGGAGACQ